MNKRFVNVFLFLCLVAESQLDGQELADPLMTRLFIMPTGEIMDEGRYMITTVDMIAIEAAYAPTSYLQVSTLMTTPLMLLFRDTRQDFTGSIGGKLQIVRANGLFPGICLGVDLLRLPALDYASYYIHDQRFGLGNIYDHIFNIYPPRTSPYSVMVNVASSFGTAHVQAHASYGQLYYVREDRGFPDPGRSVSPYAQVGFSAGGSLSNTLAMKFMVELFFSRPFDHYPAGGGIIGLRIYRPAFAFDFGVPLGSFRILPRDEFLPYVGLNVFF